MYTVLTTCPPYGSRNVGDKLIEQRMKELVQREKGEAEFVTIFREEPLDDHLDRINASRAVLMPAFPVRDTPMHPGTYRLVEDLRRIEPPLIPIGGNWNVYPGDAQSRRFVRYSEPTVAFLRHVAGQVAQLSCREYGVCAVLARHGIENTAMTGDPAWYDLASIGKPMHRPARIERVAFSPPLSPYYADQGEQIMRMLAAQFPEAQRYCAMHLADAATSGDAQDQKAENSAAMSPDVARKNRRMREVAVELGFEVMELAGRLEGMAAYDGMDLHVGYECHAHLYFFSKRRPSVLIAEDARGVGFNETLGVGGFTGFQRAQSEAAAPRKTLTSGYCTSLAELAIAPPRLEVHEAVRQFLEQELANGFRRYVGLAGYLDEIYEQVMRPFIRALP
ncbi:MAG: hypothetical protein ACODAQ_04985 [Phycisphaeraceae bacterium]